jgi:hypothetical protein
MRHIPDRESGGGLTSGAARRGVRGAGKPSADRYPSGLDERPRSPATLDHVSVAWGGVGAPHPGGTT